MNELDLISRKEVCKMYAKSYRTIINWEKKGILKAIRINGSVYYNKSKVIELSKEK